MHKILARHIVRRICADCIATVQRCQILITGDIDHLRTYLDNAADQAILMASAQEILGKEGIFFHKLLSVWVHHLAACAAGLKVTTLFVATDEIIQIDALPTLAATKLLIDLSEAYLQGLQTPLPIACKTALAWMHAKENEDADQKAQTKYEGTEWSPGEVDYDPYLQRFYPDFESLCKPEHKTNFYAWAERLYRPIINHVKSMPAKDANA